MTAIVLYLVLGTMALHAYVPMVREGVEWGYYCDVVDWGPAGEYYFRIQFSGDTIVDGEKFMFAWIYETEKLDIDNGAFSGVCMRDDNGVVYRHIGENFSTDGWHIVCEFERGELVGESTFNYPFTDIIYDFTKDDIPIRESIEIENTKRNIWDYHCYPYGDPVVLEGAGPLKYKELGDNLIGNMIFPIINLMPNGRWANHYLLYERRVDTGEIVYKSPMYDRFIAGDPTVVGIEGVRADVTERLLVTVDGLTVRSVSADTPLTLYRADGSTAAAGRGTVTAPSPGIYIVASPGAGSQKVMLH